jgi:hypothetical protein
MTAEGTRNRRTLFTVTFCLLPFALGAGAGCFPTTWLTVAPPAEKKREGTFTTDCGPPRPPAQVTAEQVDANNARAKADALRAELDWEEAREMQPAPLPKK